MSNSEDAKSGSADDASIDQAEIEALLQSQNQAATGNAEPNAGVGGASSPSTTDSVEQSTDDIELLLRQAEEAIASADSPNAPAGAGLTPYQLKSFSGSPPSVNRATLELLSDVELDLKIELGRTQMHLEDVLQLRKGAVVPLDKLAGDPVEIFVNGRLIARGEVLVLNDNFCVRVAELISGDLTQN